MVEEHRSAHPMLIHLTSGASMFFSILSQRVLLAMSSRGAVYKHPRLRDAQKVVSLSEIDLEDVDRLAARHGPFGLGFRRGWAQRHGAAPVWYLPRGSQLQDRVFAIIKDLAFRSEPVLDHFLWELTPFIDYPIDGDGQGSAYDWRWEREWRVRGNLAFAPTDVVVLFGPEADHDELHRMWRREVSSARGFPMPPLVDTTWTVARQLDTIHRGPTPTMITRSNSDEQWRTYGAPDRSEVAWDDEMERMEGYRRTLTEQQAEWSIWLSEMHNDDE